MKTTLQDWAKEVHSGQHRSKDSMREPEIHEDSQAIYEDAISQNKGISKPKKVFPLLFGVISVLIAGAGGYFLKTDTNPKTVIENSLDDLESIEVFTKEEAPPRYESVQSEALERIKLEREQMRSQERIINKVIEGFYKNGGKGYMCVTWQGKTSCRHGKKILNFKPKVQSPN